MWSKLFKLKRNVHVESVLKRLHTINKSIMSRVETCKAITNEVKTMFTLPHRLLQMI